MSWREIRLRASQGLAPAIESALEDCGAVAVTLRDAGDQPLLEPLPGEAPLWRDLEITGLFSADASPEAVLAQLRSRLGPDALALPIETGVVEDQDWSVSWRRDWRPLRFGQRLWVVPGWTAPPDPQGVNLLLDPGLAFGTGTHPSTALCLRWLDANPPRDATVVDYGCGSGILGLAALALGAARVLAVDVDPQALAATRENARRNDVAPERLRTLPPEGLGTDVEADLVLANILAGPLVALAPQLATLLRRAGRIVLAGVLEEQAGEVTAAYAPWFAMEPPVLSAGWARLSGRRTG